MWYNRPGAIQFVERENYPSLFFTIHIICYSYSNGISCQGKRENKRNYKPYKH